MKKASRKNSARKAKHAPQQKPVSSAGSFDEDLVLARDLFRQGNLPQAEIFARRCLARDGSNSGAAGLLEDLRRAYGFSTTFKLSERALPVSDRNNRFLLIKAWGYGFWSDVHHLLTQLLLAELIHRTPINLWGRNSLFRKDADTDAFGHFFRQISAARIEDIPQDASIFPPKWSWGNLYEENVNKWEGEGSRLAAQYLFNRPETLLVSDFYSTLSSIMPWIGIDSKYYGLSEDALYGALFQKYLKPVPEITAQVDEFYLRQMQGRPWVGVHMRGSDKIHESPHLAETNAGYLGFIDRIVELNPTIGIFLLTDSSTVMDEFAKRYGGRLLCTQATRESSSVGVHYSGHDGVVIGVEVLVDTLLAVKCDYFVGNMESNVSVAISSMRPWSQGFIFLLGTESVRGENLFLHKNHARPQSEFRLIKPAPPFAMKKKVLFYSDWHNGDVHMSRPYVVDLMRLLGDCDYYYHHRNNPKLLADIENLTYTPAKIDADITISTWIGQHHFKGMSLTEMAYHSASFPGCNFPNYYAVMRTVYESLNLAEFFKPIDYYLPTINYACFDIGNIEAYFANMRRPNVLICNNATLSGQAPEVNFTAIVTVLARTYPGINFLISNNDGIIPSAENIINCSAIINNPATVCDLNEVSCISTYCDLIVGRSSGPYSFSVTKDNLQHSQFMCICRSKNDTWFLPNSSNIAWTDNPTVEHVISLLSNLINEHVKEKI